MTDNGGEDSAPKGNEWEVVALTESTYSAAPGPNQANADATDGGFIGDDNSETSGALFLSAHFGVAQNTTPNENLPVDPEENLNPGGEAGSEHEVYEENRCGKLGVKDAEDLNIEGLISDEFHDSPKLNEKSNIMSFYSSGFGDVASPNLMEKEHSLYEEAGASISSLVSAGSGISEPLESPEQPLDPATLNAEKHIVSDKISEVPSNPPPESWWGRHSYSFYELVKTAYPVWSVVAAVTVVGLVIIGHRWRQDKPEVLLHLKSRFVINDEGSSWVLSPMAQLKEVNWDHKHGPDIKFASFVQQ